MLITLKAEFQDSNSDARFYLFPSPNHIFLIDKYCSEEEKFKRENSRREFKRDDGTCLSPQHL